MNNLPKSLYKFHRIVQPGTHLKMSDAKLLSFVARFMIDLAKCLHVIGNKRDWDNANVAHLLCRE